MKKYLFVIFITITTLSKAQNLRNPTDRSMNAYNNLISDFGPRYVASGSKFHGGLDYSRNTYEESYAAEGGSVSFASNSTMQTQNAYIIVGDFRYVHIHVGTIENNDLWAIIQDEEHYLLILRGYDKDNNLQTLSVFSESDYPNSEFMDDVTGETVRVSHVASEGDLIFRARDYGSAGNAGDHLHFDRGYGSWENPISFLARDDNFFPRITNFNLKYNNNGAATLFSDNLVYGNILLETLIRTDDEYDLNYFEQAISRDNQKYSKLNSWYLSGENHVNVNRISGISTEPYNTIRLVRCGENFNNINNDIREGFFPINTNGNGIAGQDVIKYIFNSNALSESSTHVLDQKYPDGEYYFRAIAQDFGYNAGISNSSKRIVDNRRPFVRKLEIHNPAGNPIYTYEWTKEGENLILTEGGSSAPMNPFYPVQINFWTSEALVENGTIGRPLVDVGNHSADYIKNTNGESWQYEILGGKLLEQDIYSIEISGKDIAGNLVFDMPDESGIISISQIPFRTTEGFTNPKKLSTNEKISVTGCYLNSPPQQLKSGAKSTSASSGCNPPNGSDGIPFASFTYSVGGAKNNIVTFSNNSEYGAYYFWEFGDGEVSYEKTPSAHEYPVESNSKAYDVSLSVSNTDGIMKKTTKKVLIPGEEAASSSLASVQAHYSVNNDGVNNITYCFHTTVIPSKPSYTVKTNIDFGDGASSSLNECHTYEKMFSAKTYYPAINVSVWDGNTFLGDIQKQLSPIIVTAQPDFDLEIDLNLDRTGILAGEEFELTANVTNGKGTHSFVWEIYNLDIENMNNASKRVEYSYSAEGVSRIKHMYPEPGNYLIKLTVNDQFGHYGSKEYVAIARDNVGCAEMAMFIESCASQYIVNANKPVNFSVDALLHNCAGEREVGKIEWYMVGPNGKTELGNNCIPDGGGGYPAGLANTTKCISFPIPGKYYVTAEVSPYDIYHHTNSAGTKRYIRIRNDDVSKITKTIIVEGYWIPEIELDARNYSDPGIEVNLNAGTIIINNPAYPTYGDAVVTNNTKHTYSANKSITINPPFYTESGSSFIAEAKEDGCIGCVPDTRKNCSYMHYSIPEEDISVKIKESWCDLGKGAYEYSYTVDSKYGGPYWANMEVRCANSDYSKGDCHYESGGRNTFCDNWCTHSASQKYQVLEDKKQSTNYFGTMGGKVEVYALAELQNAIGRNTSRKIKIGGSGIFKEGLDNLNHSNVIDSLEVNNYIDIFPNPTKKEFTLEVSYDPNKIKYIEIHNQVGQLVYSLEYNIQRLNFIDAGDWPYGIYFIRVINKNGQVLTKKLIKE